MEPSLHLRHLHGHGSTAPRRHPRRDPAAAPARPVGFGAASPRPPHAPTASARPAPARQHASSRTLVALPVVDRPRLLLPRDSPSTASSRATAPPRAAAPAPPPPPPPPASAATPGGPGWWPRRSGTAPPAPAGPPGQLHRPLRDPHPVLGQLDGLHRRLHRHPRGDARVPGLGLRRPLQGRRPHHRRLPLEPVEHRKRRRQAARSSSAGPAGSRRRTSRTRRSRGGGNVPRVRGQPLRPAADARGLRGPHRRRRAEPPLHQLIQGARAGARAGSTPSAGRTSRHGPPADRAPATSCAATTGPPARPSSAFATSIWARSRSDVVAVPSS
jgi:hypothetical protein